MNEEFKCFHESTRESLLESTDVELCAVVAWRSAVHGCRERFGLIVVSRRFGEEECFSRPVLSSACRKA